MPQTYVVHANQSYTNWIWNYGKQAVKGLGVMSLGVLGYMGLRGYWRSDEAITQTNSESMDLVSATDESTSVIKKDLTNTPVPASQNIWNAAEQLLQYRRKRDVQPVTGEIQVNTYTADIQEKPAVASLPNGQFVVTWRSYRQINSTMDYDIYAQRFAADGTKLGDEFLVNTYTVGIQDTPLITSLPDGQFIITWFSGYNLHIGIYAQRFATNGTRLGNEFRVDDDGPSSAGIRHAMAGLANGQFVVTWVATTTSYDVYAQHFTSEGIKLNTTFLVNTFTAGAQESPAITGLFNSQFVITWHSVYQVSGTSGYDIFARIFDNNGTKLGNEFQVNTNTANSQINPSITSLPSGQFVIVWETAINNPIGLYAQCFASDGTKLGTEFQVNSLTTLAPYSSKVSSIASLSNGQFVITWYGASSADPNGVFAQQFASNGTKLGSEILVNTNTVDIQTTSAVAGLLNGQFVITWASNNQVTNSSAYDIYAKIFATSYQLPTIVKNILTLDQGQTVILNSNYVSANSGGGTSYNNLIFLLSNITHGYFGLTSSQNVAITRFNQSQILNQQIQFVHDNSYFAPSYNVAVSDGINTISPEAAQINFDRRPIIELNSLQVANGKKVVLTANDILATDDRDNPDLFLVLRNVARGIFTRTTDTLLNPLRTFTQEQINLSSVMFVHDGSNIAPSYEIMANDTRLVSEYLLGQVTFIANRPPQLTLNEVTLIKGEKKVIDGTCLAAADPDATTSSELGALLFNFTDIGRGQFELSTNPNVAVFSALQSQVAAGQLVFKHDGSVQAPSYSVTVNDGYVTTKSQPAKVNFSLSNSNNAAVIGGAVGGTGAALLLAGAGIFGAYRYRRSKQLEVQRSNNPLANALYHELKIPDTEDFQSEKGIAFTNAVDSLNNELIRAGVDIKQMVPEEITELAAKLATATKAQLGKEINLLDIQDYAAGIVATAMTLSGKNLIDDTASVELEDVRSIDNKEKALFAMMKKHYQKKNINLDAMSLNDMDVLIKPLLDSDETAEIAGSNRSSKPVIIKI